jgi:hypothetical protein
MRHPLIALLCAAALSGCSAVPGTSRDVSSSDQPAPRKIASALTASLEDFRLQPAPNVRVLLRQGSHYYPNRVLPITALTSVPAGANSFTLKALDGGPDRYAMVAEGEATHIGYDAFDYLSGHLSAITATLGNTRATRIAMPDLRSILLEFPVGTSGSLKLSSEAVDGLYLDAQTIPDIPNAATLRRIKQYDGDFDILAYKIAKVTFKVKEADGTDVAGLKQENITLTVEAKDANGYFKRDDGASIEGFKDLSGGRYEITAACYKADTATGSIRVTIDVVNAPAKAKATFYRQ